MRRSIGILLAAMVAAGCANQHAPGDDPQPAPDHDAAMPKGDGPHDMNPVMARWNVTADFQINGHDPQTSARSAVAIYGSDSQGPAEVILTDVPDYCAARRAGSCPGDWNFAMVFGLTTAKPGSYSIDQGEASVYTGDVPTTCRGAGIGAAHGNVEVVRADAQPGGLLSLHFDFEWLGGSASGTIDALSCKLD